MKKILALSVLFGMFLFVGFAYAVPYTWNDVYETNFHFTDETTTLLYHHIITDSGFNVGNDFVWSYNLSIGFNNDSNSGEGEVFINLPGFITDGSFDIINYTNIERGFSLAGLIQLNTTGTLSVSLTWLSGDFYFGDSTLSAFGWESNPLTTTNPSAAPEPTTLLLLGSGLIGIGLLGRKRFRRKS
jgi:hypothetical protein